MVSYGDRKGPWIALSRRNQTTVVCRSESSQGGWWEGVGIRATVRGLGAACSLGTTETPGKGEDD